MAENEIKPGIFRVSNGLLLVKNLVDMPGLGLGTPGPATLSQDKSNNTTPAAEKPGDQYLVKKFRMLSSTTISGHGYPLDFSGMLKAGDARKFNKTIFKDHYTVADNWVGMVKNTVYNTSTNPAGMDGEFWLDRTIGEDRLIRGVDSGALNRCSVTLTFHWQKSHPKLSDEAFWERIGETIDGDLVRVIATKLEEIYEVSLVWYGADHTAKALERENPVSTDATGQSDREMNVFQGIPGDVRKKKETNMDEKLLTALRAAAGGNVKDEQLAAHFKSALDFKADVMSGLRQEVEQLEKGVSGQEMDAMTKRALEMATYQELQDRKKALEKKKLEMFPATCQSCGAKAGEIRSSVATEVPQVAGEQEPQETTDQQGREGQPMTGRQENIGDASWAIHT